MQVGDEGKTKGAPLPTWIRTRSASTSPFFAAKWAGVIPRLSFEFCRSAPASFTQGKPPRTPSLHLRPHCEKASPTQFPASVVLTPSAYRKTLHSRSPRLGQCFQRLHFPLSDCFVGRRAALRVYRTQICACLTYRGLRRRWTWKRSSSETEKAPREGTSAPPRGRNARHSAPRSIPSNSRHQVWHSNRNQPGQGTPILGPLTLPHCTMWNFQTQHGRTALPKEATLAFYCESNRASRCCARAATSPCLAASFKEMAGGRPRVVVMAVVVVVDVTLVSAMGF